MSNFEIAKKVVSDKLSELYVDTSNGAVEAVRAVTQYVRDNLKVVTEDEVTGDKRHFITSKEASREIRQIDYEMIAEVIIALENEGYEQIELPWDLPSKYVPKGFGDFAPDRRLVDDPAAAFKFLIDNGSIKRGDYFAVTPVFKPVKKDKFSQQYGLSVDIFSYQGGTVEDMTLAAKTFIRQYIKVYPENGKLVDGDGHTISTFTTKGKVIHCNMFEEPYFSKVALNIRALEKKDVHD